MQIGICDDNTDELNNIKDICVDLGYASILSFSSAGDLLGNDIIYPDLLFLDIEMDGINGINLKNHFEKK